MNHRTFELIVSKLKTEVIEAKVCVSDELKEAVVALLAQVGFHAFEETVQGVDAYIEAPLFDIAKFEGALGRLGKEKTAYKLSSLEPKNWNADWESSYPDIAIDKFCQIIPSFHQPLTGFAHTIIIDPKMSFGTGHHETTRLMIRQMQLLEITGKHVLDMGCGTGLLGILAAKMGAREVWAIDIDPWSIENATENAEINNINNIQIIEGDARVIPPHTFEIMLANINRNVLLQDIPVYANHLAQDASLILSGFFREDVGLLMQGCKACGLSLRNQMNEENWVALHLVNQ